MTQAKTKVVFCTPTRTKPSRPFVDALEASVPSLDAAGFDHGVVSEVGCPYVSGARATLLRKAMDAKADIVVFLDDDLSWQPDALTKLIQTEGDVVSGAYRFKTDDEKFMGRLFNDERGRPIVRDDGCVRAEWIPAGFLKITKEAVNIFMAAYPELCYGPRYAPLVDLFNHGARNNTWWGEDYAFSCRWNEAGQEIWVVPDMDIAHHAVDHRGKSTKAYPGNYHQFLLRQKPPSWAPKIVEAA